MLELVKQFSSALCMQTNNSVPLFYALFLITLIRNHFSSHAESSMCKSPHESLQKLWKQIFYQGGDLITQNGKNTNSKTILNLENRAPFFTSEAHFLKRIYVNG